MDITLQSSAVVAAQAVEYMTADQIVPSSNPEKELCIFIFNFSLSSFTYKTLVIFWLLRSQLTIAKILQHILTAKRSKRGFISLQVAEFIPDSFYQKI